MLVAAYAAGALVGGLPGGAAAARLGARRAVLVGLTLMGLASLGFAFAHGFWPLAAARFLQGVRQRLHLGRRLRLAARGRAARAPRRADRDRDGRRRVRRAASGRSSARPPRCSGATPSSRRSPGSRSCFAVWTLRIEPIPPEAPSLAAMRRALRNPVFVGGLVLMALPSLLFGVLSTLAPLHLPPPAGERPRSAPSGSSAPAWRPCVSPVVGRLLDRRGVLLPVQMALTAAVPISVGSRARAAPARLRAAHRPGRRRVRRALHPGLRADRRGRRAERACRRGWPSA